jgi:LysM repeat protein
MPRSRLFQQAQWLILGLLLLAVMYSPAIAQGNSHVVQSGETLFRIALRYGLTVDVMASANNLANPNQIYAGQVLVVPDGSGQTAAPAPSPSPAVSAPVYHIVQPGETLGLIAQRYGVSWQALAQSNNISNPNRILVGQQLQIMTSSTVNTAATAPVTTPTNAAVTTAPTAPQGGTHIVQPGEHLASIARKYGVSWTVIAQANGLLDPNRILVGQSLIIPSGNAAAATYLQPTTGQPSGPSPTTTNGKQIIVDLSDQRVYAYQNGQLLRNVRVSTGLPGTPTVVGDFNVYRKLNSQTMSGPGYYLPGVPWVMYFYQGYALHGTYWHSNFGQPMSHGCVNLPTDEAAWFYTFAEVGTPVRVIY